MGEESSKKERETSEVAKRSMDRRSEGCSREPRGREEGEERRRWSSYEGLLLELGFRVEFGREGERRRSGGVSSKEKEGVPSDGHLLPLLPFLNQSIDVTTGSQSDQDTDTSYLRSRL